MGKKRCYLQLVITPVNALNAHADLVSKVPSPPPSREEIRGPWERGCAYARIKRPNPPSLLQTKDTAKLQPSNMISKLLYSMFFRKRHPPESCLYTAELSRALVLRLVERSYRAITSWNRERGGKRTLLHHYYCIASITCKDAIQIQQVLSS